MASLKSIRDFHTSITGTRNNLKVTEQETDMKFFLDEYDMPLIKDPKYQIRTGYVAGMINGVTNQMIGQNPRGFTKPKSDDNDVIKEAAARVASEVNRWLKSWLWTLQNPYRRTFKDINVSGEMYIYMVHDQNLAKWDKDKHDGKTWQKEMPRAIPVIPIFYNPKVVFHDPAEDVNGQPTRVVVSFERLGAAVHKDHPNWTGEVSTDGKTKYFLYVDSETIYAEAGTQTLFHRKNIYETMNFAHAYSGWGIEEEGKEPSLLAFSRPRMMRNLIVEASTMSSDIALNAHKFAHGQKTIILPNGVEPPDNMLESYQNAPDAISILRMPDGGKFETEEPLLLGPQVFGHLGYIESKLNTNFPGVLQGSAPGISGRQDDRAAVAGLSIYDSPMENNNILWATILDIGMKIVSKVPDMMPPKLNKGDVDSYSELTVDLSKEDPIEQGRRLNEGLGLWEKGVISMEELHTKYMGKTVDESKILQAATLVEKVKKEHPAIRQLILETVGQEIQQEEELKRAQASVEATGTGETGGIGSQGGEPRTGNIQTPAGAESPDLATTHETRLSPRG